ncbi:MAG: hypothetical protein Q9183_006129, partial [Haloplaca sp. 2 TL-2023]
TLSFLDQILPRDQSTPSTHLPSNPYPKHHPPSILPRNNVLTPHPTPKRRIIKPTPPLPARIVIEQQPPSLSPKLLIKPTPILTRRIVVQAPRPIPRRITSKPIPNLSTRLNKTPRTIPRRILSNANANPSCSNVVVERISIPLHNNHIIKRTSNPPRSSTSNNDLDSATKTPTPTHSARTTATRQSPRSAGNATSSIAPADQEPASLGSARDVSAFVDLLSLWGTE